MRYNCYNVFNYGISLQLYRTESKRLRKLGEKSMKTTAIICEYNPMTLGHVRHLELARAETGAEIVLCVMSGSFTQRGEAAVLDKYVRAEAAVRLGADIVVELPTVYAISPADNFAYGAIKTIAAFPDVAYISFGSECGDIALLEQAAALLADEPEEFRALLRQNLDNGLSFPKARAAAFDAYADRSPERAVLKGLLDQPNNVLGIAYIVAAKKAGLSIGFHTVKRLGDFHDQSLDAPYPSASAVRAALQREDFDGIRKSIPAPVYESLKAIRPADSFGDMVLFKLKSISGYDLEHYYDVSGGIHNRIKIAADRSHTYEQMLEAAKTKAYTMARLKRICLYALFDITAEFYREAAACPAYLTVLAMRADRKQLLSDLHASCKNVVTRYSDVGKVDKSLRPLIKLDFTAQGTLNIINKTNCYNKKMLFVDASSEN